MPETLTPVQSSALVQVKNPDLVGSIPVEFQNQPKDLEFDMKRRLDNWVAERGSDKDSHKDRKSVAKAIENDLKRREKSKHLRNSDVLKRSQVARDEAARLINSQNPDLKLQPDGSLLIKSLDFVDPIEKSAIPGKWGESGKKYRLELLQGRNKESIIARKVLVNADNTSGSIVEQAVIGVDGSTSLTILPTGSSFQYDTNNRQEAMVGRDVVAKDEDGNEKREKAWDVTVDGVTTEVQKPVLTTEAQPLVVNYRGEEIRGVGTNVNFASPDIKGATDMQEGAITLFNQIATKIFVESKKIPELSGIHKLEKPAYVIGKKIDKWDLNTRNLNNRLESSMDLWSRENLDPPYNNYSPEYLQMIQDESRLKELLAGSRFEGQTFKEWFDEMGFISRAMKRKGRVFDVKGGNGFLPRSLQEWTGWGDELVPYIEDPNEDFIKKARELFPKNGPTNFTNAYLPDLLDSPESYNFPPEFDNVLWTVDSFIDFTDNKDLSILEGLFNKVDSGGRLIIPFPNYERSFNHDGLTRDEVDLKLDEINRVNRLLSYLETARAQKLGLKLGGMIRNDRSSKGLVIWIDSPTRDSNLDINMPTSSRRPDDYQ